MSKKTEKNLNQITDKDIEAMDEKEMLETLKNNRNDIIESFNKAFKDIAVMKEEESIKEFKEQAKNDYEQAIKDFQEATYEIYKGDRAIEVAKFLYEWNKRSNNWQRQAWKGVIAFDDIMSKKIEEMEKAEGEQSVVLEYAPMMFIYGSMMAPTGVGLEAAREMEIYETDPDGDPEDETSHITYTNILEWIGRKVDGLKAVQNKIQALQERWTMAESGFMFDFADTAPETFVKFIKTASERGPEEHKE